MDKRSIIMVRITMGNKDTDKPLSIPSLWLNKLITAMIITTKVKTTDKRGNSCNFRYSRYDRSNKPKAVIMVKNAAPKARPVSRKAKATSTGVQVPSGCKGIKMTGRKHTTHPTDNLM